jgi:TonB family protein
MVLSLDAKVKHPLQVFHLDSGNSSCCCMNLPQSSVYLRYEPATGGPISHPTQHMRRKKTMTRGILPASILLLIVVSGGPRGLAQTNDTTPAPVRSISPPPVKKILMKDPEYIKLLNPSLGDDFLQTYSKAYREKSAEIEATVADIGDEKLRNQARNNEWTRVLKKDRDKYRNEAEATFNEAKVLFLQRHQDGWFEVGHVAYDENNNSLVVISSPTAPIDTNFRVIMNRTMINQIYDKFRQIAGEEIDKKAREYVSKAGAESICSRNPDWCYTFEKGDLEQSLRTERMVVVGQGDLGERRIDRLLLVDYETEAVLQEMDPHVSALNNAAWRFSIALVPVVSKDLGPTETLVQPAADATSGSSGVSAPKSPTDANSTPARIRVPGKVTAASIVTQTRPQYPPQARAGRVQGDVVLHAIIDKEGKISEVQVLSGDDLLAQSAIEAVRQWRYKPMLFDGEPAEVDTTITVTFSLVD